MLILTAPGAGCCAYVLLGSVCLTICSRLALKHTRPWSTLLGCFYLWHPPKHFRVLNTLWGRQTRDFKFKHVHVCPG